MHELDSIARRMEEVKAQYAQEKEAYRIQLLSSLLAAKKDQEQEKLQQQVKTVKKDKEQEKLQQQVKIDKKNHKQEKLQQQVKSRNQMKSCPDWQLQSRLPLIYRQETSVPKGAISAQAKSHL